MSSADTSKEEQKYSKAARRLCELFRGRFSEEVVKKLIEDLGGELEAVDFVLNEDPEVVSRHLKETTTYLEDLRSDAAKIATLLEKGIEYEVRQFACGPCNRSWWKKVPFRKQVCKCKRCKTKYDPVPHESEWGWAKFVCSCSNEFHAFGEMGKTTSKCYKCNVMVPVNCVLPPRKRIGQQKKSNNTHSCSAPNCFNQCDDSFSARASMNMYSQNSTHMSHHNNITYVVGAYGRDQDGWNTYNKKKGNSNSAGAAQSVSAGSSSNEPPVCIHPLSNRPGTRIRTESKVHISTGSTVATFLSQGSLDTMSIATMQTIHE